MVLTCSSCIVSRSPAFLSTLNLQAANWNGHQTFRGIMTKVQSILHPIVIWTQEAASKFRIRTLEPWPQKLVNPSANSWLRRISSSESCLAQEHGHPQLDQHLCSGAAIKRAFGMVSLARMAPTLRVETYHVLLKMGCLSPLK